jgi:1-phosphofructokinase
MLNDMIHQPRVEVVTVTLNPAIDQTVTIPNFAAGKVNRVEQVQSTPGGKGVNVAAALADYGHSVAVTGFLGRENCIPFETMFAQKRIADHFVRIAGQTRVGIKITDPVAHQTTDINFPGQAPTRANLAALEQRLGELASRWVVMAGSIPPAVTPAIYRELIQTVKAQGRRVILDTSDAGLHEALIAAPQIIKPNIHELEALIGRSLPTRQAVIAAARALLAQGIELVVVSMGREGACFVTAERVVIAHPPDVVIKSTVGAGDAMVAGIVAGQLRKLPLEQCARLATAFALDALTHIGAGLSAPSAIEGLMNTVEVEVSEYSDAQARSGVAG